MTARNSYATLSEYKNYVTDRAGNTPVTNQTDDGVIDQILEQASRYIDSKTGRWFFPSIETRHYDIPGQPGGYARDLYTDADLLEVISFLNGDGTTIASTEYNVLPKNESPKWLLQLKQLSAIVWELDSDGEYEYVLDLLAVWGYHNRYAEAWKSAGTLGAAITDTTTLAFTMTAGHAVGVGKIYRIDNELYIPTTVSTNTITPLKRGENGSTAATHLINTVVYEWQPMEDLRNATMELANNAYHRRFGQSLRSEETITAAGIVLTPREVPHLTKEFIKTYQRNV
jgi:hypothetical protein